MVGKDSVLTSRCSVAGVPDRRSGVMSTSRRMVAALSSALLLITLPGAAPSSADPGNHTHKVFAPKSTPYNRTHEVWLARYMRWLQEIPTGPKTPLRPAGTRNCEVHGHLVFVGPHGTTRGCTVPEGKATATLLALGWECSTAEGDGRTYRSSGRVQSRISRTLTVGRKFRSRSSWTAST